MFRKPYRHLFRFLLALLCTSFLVSCSGAKEYILMIDTSGSMAANERPLEEIKSDVVDFVGKLALGDAITLMTFDSTVKRYKTYKLNQERNRQELVDQVLALQARGAYTDVDTMLVALAKTSDELQVSGRQLYIIIVSDGLDDPPPEVRKLREDALVDLRSIEKKSQVNNEWWGMQKRPYIYYLSLRDIRNYGVKDGAKERAEEKTAMGPFKSSEVKDGAEEKDKDKEKLDKVKKKLSLISDQVKVVDASKERDLSQAIAMEDIGLIDYWRITLYVLSALVFMICIVVICYKLYTRHKLNGSLTYCDVSLNDWNISQSFHLNKLSRHQFKLGSKMGAQLKIRDIGLKQNLSLRTKKYGELLCLKPVSKEADFYTCDSETYKKSGLIAPGDKFTVGNYIFKYTNDTTDN